MNYYPLNEEAARTAWGVNHFGEFRSDKTEYMASVDEAYAIAEEVAQQCPKNADRARVMADRYAKKLADWYNKKYHIESMCPSVMISGPANFPVHKKSKQNIAYDKHWEEYGKLKSLLERIEQLGKPSNVIKSDDDDVIEKLRAKIEDLTRKQEAMKAANAKARREGREVPYPSFSLSNNSQNIRATRKRLERLEAAKQRGTTKRTADLMGESVEIIENAELMRLQLVFDGKPSDEVRTALKKHGFRWSPKNGAWQRQLTNNARFVLKQMMDNVRV